MKINCINNPTFQKKLMATCAILKNGKKENVNIYLLDEKKDEEIYRKTMEHSAWRGSILAAAMHYDFIYSNKSQDMHFVMEDKKQNPLCFASIQNKQEQNNLMCIETAPKYSMNYKKRHYRYIGETMIAFLIELTKKADKKLLCIPCILKDENTKHFYFKQCDFKTKTGNEAWLKKRGFEQMLRKNSEHTGSKIDLIN